MRKTWIRIVWMRACAIAQYVKEYTHRSKEERLCASPPRGVILLRQYVICDWIYSIFGTFIYFRLNLNVHIHTPWPKRYLCPGVHIVCVCSMTMRCATAAVKPIFAVHPSLIGKRTHFRAWRCLGISHFRKVAIVCECLLCPTFRPPFLQIPHNKSWAKIRAHFHQPWVKMPYLDSCIAIAPVP